LPHQLPRNAKPVWPMVGLQTGSTNNVNRRVVAGLRARTAVSS